MSIMVAICGVAGLIGGLVIDGVSLLSFLAEKREGKHVSWLLYILASVVAAVLICLLGVHAQAQSSTSSPPTSDDFAFLGILWAIWGASPGLGLLVGLLTLLRKRGVSPE